MRKWPLHPRIYEINTWVWLEALSKKYRQSMDLATIPEEEWDLIGSFGFDVVWLMGVWERSPAGIALSMQNKELIEDLRRALPDFKSEDIKGSPYCVRRYVVDQQLGGPQGLAVARQSLAKRGISLILDFVPNHVALDHPLVNIHPDYFIRGESEDAKNNPAVFIEIGKNVFALGRDHYFSDWSDVLQFNVFHPSVRRAAIETISAIAEQCDGVRCDLAMLLLNTVFEKRWGARAGFKPSEEYWKGVIAAIKKDRSEFKFIAESYWDLDWQLLQQGFDFCYDKKLYDRMEHLAPESMHQHLLGDLSYQEKMVRFIENHDEQRAAAIFPDEIGRVAALVTLTLPGARLLQEGQFEGIKERLPISLSRRSIEPINHDLLTFYTALLQETKREVFRSGDWRLCEWSGWPDNLSYKNILAWCWRKEAERYLIVINFSDKPSQALVRTHWKDLQNRSWRLNDTLSGEFYDRSGNEMVDAGLYIDLDPWKYHFFQLQTL